MIKIVADNSCDIVEKMVKENDLYTFEPVVVKINLDGVEYTDDFTENANVYRDNYLNAMEASENVPRTSAPSPETFLKAIEEGEHDTVFIVCMSSNLSATYSSALLAKQLHEDGNNDKQVFVIDSLACTAGATNIVLKIIDDLEQNVAPEEIFNKMDNFAKTELRFYAILKSLRNLEKNGRISPSVAKLASIMSLRPICKAVNGVPVLDTKARGSRAYKKMIDIIAKDNVNHSERILTITHVRVPEIAEQIKEEVEKRVNFKEIIIAEPTCLCINYGERGGIMLGY